MLAARDTATRPARERSESVYMFGMKITDVSSKYMKNTWLYSLPSRDKTYPCPHAYLRVFVWV